MLMENTGDNFSSHNSIVCFSILSPQQYFGLCDPLVLPSLLTPERIAL